MISVYIHIPYCIHKCSYCDFYSIENLNSLEKFVDALCKEIEISYSLFSHKESTQAKSNIKSNNIIDKSREIVIGSIFFGGGTPSLLRPKHFEKIMSQIKKHFLISDELELTLECNPETVQLVVLKNYKQLGANRLSLGIQSFIESELAFLERTHNVYKAEKSIINGREAGFDNINIDLIYAIPGQTYKSLEFSLDKAISFKPENIAAYSLIYEPETPLYKALQKGKVSKVSEEFETMMYKLCIEKLSRAGYIHYEVSNFALNGKQCRHNINYWHGGSYLGFGPSAHGYINGKRYWNYRSLKKYFDELDSNRLPIQNTETIGINEMLDEYIMLGLRSDGIDMNCLKEKFNINLSEKMNAFIQYLIKNGKVKSNSDIISLTAEGYLVSDELIVEFLKRLQ